MFDYFYGAQSDQFSFYRVPKVMFTDPAFQDVSAEAKILYGLFLDRMGLSARNNWVDEQGRVYIIYTIDQIMKAIGCSDKKVNRMLRELEVGAGLIERKRQGLGKPNLIYVKNFLSVGQNGRILNRKMDDSGVVETQFLESSEVRGSNTEINNTEYSDSNKKIDTYVHSLLGERHSISTIDVSISDSNEFILFLLCTVRGREKGADYTVDFKSGYVDCMGYNLPDITISRKGDK